MRGVRTTAAFPSCRGVAFPYLTSSKNLSSSRAGNCESLEEAEKNGKTAVKRAAPLPPRSTPRGSTHFICTPFLASTITKLGSMFLVISSNAFSGIISARKHTTPPPSRDIAPFFWGRGFKIKAPVWIPLLNQRLCASVGVATHAGG